MPPPMGKTPVEGVGNYPSTGMGKTLDISNYEKIFNKPGITTPLYKPIASHEMAFMRRGRLFL